MSCWDCNKRFNLTSGLESAGLYGVDSCPGLSSLDVKLNLLLQSQHMNPVRSLIQNYFAV